MSAPSVDVAPVAIGPSTAGLSSEEARRRLNEQGANAVPRLEPVSTWSRVAGQLTDPLVLLLLAALAVTLAIGDVADASIIALVIVVNTAIGVVQEVRADRAIGALDGLAPPTARAVRDGVDVVIPAAELVVGDVVTVDAGSVVPADLCLITAHRTQVDESALTGESVPVDRDAGSELAAGTVVVAGRATGTVVRTGAASALGRIAAAVVRTRPGPTPLQRRMRVLGRQLGIAVVAASAIVFGVGIVHGRPALEMAVLAASLIVAAVPESLPAVVTVALALGARRMAARRAVPRRLHAVETLGSVTVVASDKTGTLTEGRMVVRCFTDAAGREYTVDAARVSGTAVPAELARAAVLCNDAMPAEGNQPPYGDPVEVALLAFAEHAGVSAVEARAAWPRIGEEPFDAATRRMTTRHRRADGTELVVCKGAPEAVLVPALVGTVPDGILDAATRFAASGLRVLAVLDSPGAGSGLRFVGLVGIGDPVRAKAPGIARDLDTAGIRLVLITGDHPATAAAVAQDVGIFAPGDGVHHGGSGAPDADAAERVRVFARVPPEQKLDIVAALQGRGHIVAMTGDGVNDAPALRRADIGVAMGGGTEVARQAADLVLLDDDLATLTVAVGEGRRIYDNIRRFLHYALAGGTAELLVMLIGPVVGLAVPLLPAQILWVNLLTHGVPGVALGAEPAERGILRRPPRPAGQSILSDGLATAILSTGAILALVVLGVGVIAAQQGRAWQSMVFVVLGLGQLGIALAVRTRRRRGGERQPALAFAVASSGLLQLAPVLVPPLRGLFGTSALSPAELAWCLAAACLPGLVLAAGSRLGLRLNPARGRR